MSLQPAARVGDPHACPKSEGSTPHVGGPVAAGSPNVFIESLAAVRVGDALICCGPPDAVAAGSATVFFNSLPAARATDATAHTGTISAGASRTFIGHGTGAADKGDCLRRASASGSATIS